MTGGPFSPPERPPWFRRAACRGCDPSMFVSGMGQNDLIQLAKAVCARCPVTEPCLESAIERNEKGVWGGTTPEERGAIVRRRAEGSAS